MPKTRTRIDDITEFLRRQYDELRCNRGYSHDVIMEASGWATKMNHLASDDEMAEICDVIERVRSWDPRGEVKPPASENEITMLCRDVAGEPIN